MNFKIKQNILHYYVDLLRDQKWNKTGGALHNIIRTMKITRYDKVCGEDFSRLDLGNIPFNGIQFSLDGEIPCNFDGCKLNEWNLMCGHIGRLKGVAFSSDGKLAFTVAEDEKVLFWDVVTGLTVRKMRKMQFLRSFPTLNFGGSTAVSSDGIYRMTSSKSDSTALLTNAKSGQIIKILKGHSDYIRSVAFSPDGTKCLTGSFDGTARIWETKSGICLHKLGGYINTLQYIQIAPDEKTFLAVSYLSPIYRTPRNETHQLWDIKTEKCIYTQYCSTD